MAKRASGTKASVTPLPTRRPSVVRQSWGYTSIQMALTMAQQGDPSHLVQLGRIMMCHPSFSSAANKRTNGILRSRLTVEWPQDATSEELAATETIEGDLALMLEEDQFGPFLKSDLLYPKAVAVAIPDRHPDDATRILFYLYSLSTEHCRYKAPDKANDAEHRWFYRQDGEEIEIEPGKMFRQAGAANVWITAQSWTPMFPTGMVAQLALLWARDQFAGRSEDDLNNNAAKALLVGKVPSVITDQDQIDTFADQLTDVPFGDVLAMRDNYDAKYISPGINTSTDGPRRVQEDFARKCAVVANGGNLASENDGSGGSYAQAKVHMTEGQLLIQGDVERIGRVISSQLLPHYMEANFPALRVPRVTWTDERVDDPERLMQAIQLAKEMGLELDDPVDVFTRLGLTVKKPAAAPVRPAPSTPNTDPLDVEPGATGDDEPED